MLKIVALVKHTPELTGDRHFASDLTVDRPGVAHVLSELDEYTAEQALRLAESQDGVEITYLTMGPSAAGEALRKALSMGGDKAVHISDERLHGSDALATSMVLAQAISRIGFDLVLCGMASTDANMGVVPSMLAERLGIPGLSFANSLTIDGGTVLVERDLGTGAASVESVLPALVSVTDRIGEVRYPSFKGIMAAKKKPVEVWSLDELGVDPGQIGLEQSYTQVLSAARRPPRQSGDLVKDDGDGGVKLADYLTAQKFI
jgi:electron transfer flavoprotein beta subunit